MEKEPQLPKPVDAENSGAAAPAGFTTLIVDCNFFFAGFLEALLEGRSHTFLRAATAREALVKTREFQPELILLDSHMDGISGLALLPLLLAEKITTAVILMTHAPSATEARAAIGAGAVGYLKRPLDPRALKAAIESVLG
jgi:DNA-binding response OmpR family regulator